MNSINTDKAVNYATELDLLMSMLSTGETGFMEEAVELSSTIRNMATAGLVGLGAGQVLAQVWPVVDAQLALYKRLRPLASGDRGRSQIDDTLADLTAIRSDVRASLRLMHRDPVQVQDLVQA